MSYTLGEYRVVEVNLKNSLSDWHLKIGSDVLVKRRQEEEARSAMDAMASRIIAAKRRRLAELCPNGGGQTRNDALQFSMDSESQQCGRERSLWRPLRMPPMTGVAWYGVCSGNKNRRGYLVARPRDVDGHRQFGHDLREETVDGKFCESSSPLSTP